MREETKIDESNDFERNAAGRARPDENFVMPKQKENVPFLNFAPLQNALAKLNESARNYQRRQTQTDFCRRRKRVWTKCFLRPNATLTERRFAAPRLVQASNLRARILYRLRRENSAGRARSHRTARLERSGRANFDSVANHRKFCRGN